MDTATKILSDITVFTKYAKFLPNKERRETWEDIVNRNMDMHLDKYPDLAVDIYSTYTAYVLPKKVLPSMRSLQFGGTPILKSPNRVFNCAYLPVEKTNSFQETMFLLLGGTGVGYSVQKRHVDELPNLQGPDYRERRFLIGDSIEGWADSIKVLVEAYFHGKIRPVFDFSDIRVKGAELVTSGGKAPGPDPLRVCLQQLETLLKAVLHERGRGTKLKPIEVHDLICFIADAVLAGGIRRAALICLFDRDDEDMLNCKSGEWYLDNPQRGRANNSAVLPREDVSRQEFMDLMLKVQDSGAGEPGVYWTHDLDWGCNPCCEISLKPYQFCNL